MDKNDVHFSLISYVRDKALFIVLWLVFVVLLTLVFGILNLSTGGIIFLDVLLLVGPACLLTFDYLRQASFWKSVEEATRSLEKGAYVIDLVDEPSFLKGQITYDALTAIIKTDNQEITDLKTTVHENAEYTELWVHEAKTPLAAAKLITKRMRGVDALALRRELERLDDLIGQALFVSRTETLTRDYLIREINLAEIAKEACKTHVHYLTSLNTSLEFHIDPAITVFADKMWLEFIITQIVINAAKYDAATITLTAFAPEEESSSSATVLEIKDDGCGIPSMDVPRVFDRGFTGEVGRAHGSATGMGLYLVARMCASMGLSIMLASEEGVGTRVQIKFPHDRRRAYLEASNREGN